MVVSMSLMEITLVVYNYGMYNGFGVSTNPVIPSVRKICSPAGKDISAWTNHVLGEGKLLTVEDKGVSVFPEAVVAVSAFLLQSLKSISLVINLFIIVLNVIVVAVDCVMVLFDFMLVLTDAILKVVDFVVQVDKCFSDSFKGDHQLGFGLNSLLIIGLVPDFFPFVEVIHLMPEVTMRNVAVGFIWVTIVGVT